MKIQFLSLYLLGSLVCYSQEDLTELDKRNGFKNIKMGMSIDSLEGTVFIKDIKEKGHFPAKSYDVVHENYSSIGDVPVNKVSVKAYKGLIYEISVLTAHDTRLMRGLESTLGKPVYDVRDESYTWMGKNLTMKFRTAPKKQFELLYSSAVIKKMMVEDKHKKIGDIAQDF
jgi:hypothetical protein